MEKANIFQKSRDGRLGAGQGVEGTEGREMGVRSSPWKGGKGEKFGNDAILTLTKEVLFLPAPKRGGLVTWSG